jgi:hypothetical protein
MGEDWQAAFHALAHELGVEEVESVDQVLAIARLLRSERDVAMGDASMDAAALTLESLRAENARLKALVRDHRG